MFGEELDERRWALLAPGDANHERSSDERNGVPCWTCLER